MPYHRYFSGPYNTRTFKRSLNADILYNYNTPPQTPRQPSQPQLSQPRSSQLGSSQTGSSQFGSSQTGSSQFGSSQFGSSQFGSSQTGSSQIRSPQPGPSQTILSQPRPSQSEPLLPPPFQPRSSQPKSPQPLPSQPRSSQPRSPQPLPSQPRSSHPRSPQPLPSQPRSSQPRSPQPLISQPLLSQPRSSQPRSSQPRSPQPGPSQYRSSQPRSPQPGPSHLRPMQSQSSQSRSSIPGPSELQSSYFVPTQSYYNSYYNSNYQEIEHVPTGYDQEYTDYEYQQVPTFYLHVDVYEPTEGLVWVYLCNLDTIFVPEDYYDETLLVYIPPEMEQEQEQEQDDDGQVLAEFIRNRHLYLLPEDAAACLDIVETLMPLQIATKRLPGFFQIVKKPVILGNIKHRILDGKYNRLVDVIHDLRAIVWNIDYYLSQRREDLIEGDNDLFSLILEGQLQMYYRDLNFNGITGDPDNKPE